MTAAAPRCPDTAWRTANLAKRHAWWIEHNPALRMVPVPCEQHGWHLAPRDAAHDPGGISADGTDDTKTTGGN